MYSVVNSFPTLTTEYTEGAEQEAKLNSGYQLQLPAIRLQSRVSLKRDPQHTENPPPALCISQPRVVHLSLYEEYEFQELPFPSISRYALR